VAFRIEYLDGLHIMDQMVVYCECNVILGINGSVIIRTVRTTTSVWHAFIHDTASSIFYHPCDH
jgi:hypothetical protein